MSATKADMTSLREMLGIDPRRWPRSQWGWRNYAFAADQHQVETMQRLAAAGYTQAGRVVHGVAYFHATEAGCIAAGLDRAGVQRALKNQHAPTT